MKIGSKERDLFLKLCRYCAYRERAESEVRKKMLDLEIAKPLQDELIQRLKEENFVNEKRFAVSYAGGKFRNNAWGRRKISGGLREKKIPRAYIEFALAKIEDEVYRKQIIEIIHKKYPKYKEKNLLHTRKKIADFLQRKGFEISLVWELLKQELPD